ncbi:HNH endonuclease signature motif containing protein [Amycolatopsis pigmentata]|uniref:DUF222 domain-containing protein n=1 Tax=Amycolatopsis pigmentata TaxID=450801 RepID=A0ABW5FYJ1_9PSEU
MSDQHHHPDLPEQSRSTPGKALPWLETGDDTDTLADLEASVRAALRRFSTAGMSRGGLLRALQRLQAIVNQAQAMQAEAVAEFDRTADQPSHVSLELSLGLVVSKHTAQYQIGLARALTTRLPQTLEAMRRGEIDSWKASRIYEPTVVLSDEKAREVDAIMAARIAGKDPSGLRRSTNLAVARVDPDGHAERCAQRRAQRRVELIPMEDGMVNLSSHLPVEEGVAAYTRIDTEAKRRRKRDRSKTLDQHRADFHTELLLADHGASTAPPRAEVFIYMDLYTWLGLNNHPAEMAGGGVIPAWLARRIAAGGNTTLRRIITDPDTGQILSVGRDRYRPPAALSRLVSARDRECRLPTCHRPAQHCETDHVDDWYALHGDTADDNLTALCTRDHHTKDLPGWSYHLDKHTGTFTVTTPTNDHYTSNPEPLHLPRTNPLHDDSSDVPDINPPDSRRPHANSADDNPPEDKPIDDGEHPPF